MNATNKHIKYQCSLCKQTCECISSYSVSRHKFMFHCKECYVICTDHKLYLLAVSIYNKTFKHQHMEINIIRLIISYGSMYKNRIQCQNPVSKCHNKIKINLDDNYNLTVDELIPHTNYWNHMFEQYKIVCDDCYKCCSCMLCKTRINTNNWIKTESSELCTKCLLKVSCVECKTFFVDEHYVNAKMCKICNEYLPTECYNCMIFHGYSGNWRYPSYRYPPNCAKNKEPCICAHGGYNYTRISCAGCNKYICGGCTAFYGYKLRFNENGMVKCSNCYNKITNQKRIEVKNISTLMDEKVKECNLIVDDLCDEYYFDDEILSCSRNIHLSQNIDKKFKNKHSTKKYHLKSLKYKNNKKSEIKYNNKREKRDCTWGTKKGMKWSKQRNANDCEWILRKKDKKKKAKFIFDYNDMGF